MARISKSDLAAEIKADAVLAYIVEKNIPLTHQNYLTVADLGYVPEPLGVEEEAGVPSFLQDWRVRHAA